MLANPHCNELFLFSSVFCCEVFLGDCTNSFSAQRSSVLSAVVTQVLLCPLPCFWSFTLSGYADFLAETLHFFPGGPRNNTIFTSPAFWLEALGGGICFKKDLTHFLGWEGEENQDTIHTGVRHSRLVHTHCKSILFALKQILFSRFIQNTTIWYSEQMPFCNKYTETNTVNMILLLYII